MPQIIREPTLASSLGASLGTGLGQALQTMMGQKLQQLAQRQESARAAQGLEALGISAPEAEQISLLPRELQSAVVRNYLQEAEATGLGEALATLQEPTIGLMGGLRALQEPTAISPEVQPEVGVPEEITAPERVRVPKEIPIAKEVEALERPSITDILRRPRISPEQQLKVAQLRQVQQREERKRQHEIDLETKDLYKDVNKSARAAIENSRRLGRMEELVKEGKLSRPGFHNLLSTINKGLFGFGLNLHFLESPQSQEFMKLSNEFLKNAREIFGARVTDNEVRVFLQMVPTLSQSDEGKRRVIYNMEAINDAARMRKKAMDDLIAENDGRRPANLESLIDQRIDPQIDALAERFKKGYTVEPAKKEPKKGIFKYIPEPLEVPNPLDILLGR